MVKNIKRRSNQKIKGELYPPPDKSITHRSIIFASIGEGSSRIYNPLEADDCLKTLRAFKGMGVQITKEDNFYLLKGNGLSGLTPPADKIDCGNSGTTMRLLSGLLAGQEGSFVLTGDQSLKNRPMKRILHPLRRMGADIKAQKEDNYAPLTIKGSKLSAINYKLPVASAQLKSALLLANLYTAGKMVLKEPKVSRDHTEIIMESLGLDIKRKDLKIEFNSTHNIKVPNNEYRIPGDFSQAAYFMTAALLIPGSELLIKSVNLNPTRTGFLQVIIEMGAEIEIANKKKVNGELIGDIVVKHSELEGVNVNEDFIPSMIDEIPLIAVLALKATGKTTIRSAEELRVKESDRLVVLKNAFDILNLDINTFEDGFEIKGPQKIEESGVLDPKMDHRMAMTLSVLGLIAKYGIGLQDTSCINNSFPRFFDKLDQILY